MVPALSPGARGKRETRVHRIFGATAIFAGWLSLGVGAMAGMVVSEFFGLNHVEGPLPPLAVYGISGAVVLWMLVGTAIVTVVPMAMAMVADDPRRNLRIWALLMALGGVSIIPDPLGRAFGLPLLGGAAFLLIGGELVHRAAVETDPAPGSAPTATPSPAPTFVPSPMASQAGGAPLASVPPIASGPEVVPAVEAATLPPDPTPARGRGRRTSRPMPEPEERTCPWCSTAVPTTADSCPSCGAILDAPAADEVPIPGLTVVPPELQRYADRARGRKRGTSLLDMIFREESVPTDKDTPPPSDTAALQPPSRDLKAEMARLDAEIAAGAFPNVLEPASPERGGPEPEPAEPRPAPRRRKPRT